MLNMLMCLNIWSFLEYDQWLLIMYILLFWDKMFCKYVLSSSGLMCLFKVSVSWLIFRLGDLFTEVNGISKSPTIIELRSISPFSSGSLFKNYKSTNSKRKMHICVHLKHYSQQSRCGNKLNAHQQMNDYQKMWHIYTMEYNSAIKTDEISHL